MHLALLHYHLNPGGVTSVMAGHLRSLAAHGWAADRRVVICCDGQRDGWPAELADPAPPRLEWETIPHLAYDERLAAPVSGERLATDIEAALARHGLRPENCLVHIHNHSLGKNTALPEAVAELARRGFALLLQTHDFAEDMRPHLYRRLKQRYGPEGMGSLYPQARRIHYAVLNRRDRDVLLAAGADPERVHFLPNPAAPPPRLPDRGEARRQLAKAAGLPLAGELLLYPVRGIARKNLGEFLLLLLLHRGRLGALTLAPRNPAESPRFSLWTGLAEELRLPCWFDLGGRWETPLPISLAAADWMATTSVAEGFGMTMLEPWLCGRGLLGRDLPEVTADFREEGLQLSHLYPRLRTPLEWLDRESAAGRWRRAVESLAEAYDAAPPSREQWRELEQRKWGDEQVDFGDLSPEDQAALLRRVATDKALRSALSECNPGALDTAAADAAIDHNAAVVRDRFSLAVCGRRLEEIYQRVVAESGDARIAPAPHPEKALQRLLNFDALRLVRLN